MNASQDTKRPQASRAESGLRWPRCPTCGSSRLQFGGDQKDPWLCLACGAGCQMPAGLPSTGPEQDAPAASQIAAPAEIETRKGPGSRTEDAETSFKSGSAAASSPRLGLLDALSWPLRLATLLAALFAIIIGAHGLYVYLHVADGVLGADKDAAGLFLAVGLPSTLAGVVSWCSEMALSSWAIPVSLIFGGGLLLWIREK
jgi:hypothetical protein